MRKIIAVFIIVVFAFSLPGPMMNVFAQSATSQTWTSSITYYTPSDDSGSLSITYYDGSSSYSAGPYSMNPHAAGSVSVGSTSSVPDDFAGSAVLSADVPIVATYVQYSESETYDYSRVFYTGFDLDKAGSEFYLATVRSTGVTTSVIGVQNVEDFEITATLDFYAVGAASPTFTHVVDIKSKASFVSELSDVPNYPGGSFDGSLKITATKKGDSNTDGRVVASAYETQDSGRGVIGYEGSKEGATTVYSPTAACRRATFEATSYFAVQNAGDATATVKISYYDTAGTKVGETPLTSIGVGAKWQTNPCDQSLLVGALGSAVFESTNGIPIIVIGKYYSNDGLITAFTGEPSGGTQIAAPYIRWASDSSTNYRAYVAVMNIGSSPAVDIVAKYYDASGTLRGSETIASGGSPLNQFIKANTNPSSAGALVDGSFGLSPYGGAVEIESDQPVVVLVRLITNPSGLEVSTLGEDYNGTVVAP